MKSRREFIVGSTIGLTALGAVTAMAGGKRKHSKKAKGLPENIVYTAEQPGNWKGKAGSHAPVVEVEGNTVTVTTNHGMSEGHYIVRHTLVAADGTVLGSKTFEPDDEKAVSVYKLKKVPKHLYATSFCNLHDFWVTKA